MSLSNITLKAESYLSLFKPNGLLDRKKQSFMETIVSILGNEHPDLVKDLENRFTFNLVNRRYKQIKDCWDNKHVLVTGATRYYSPEGLIDFSNKELLLDLLKETDNKRIEIQVESNFSFVLPETIEGSTPPKEHIQPKTEKDKSKQRKPKPEPKLKIHPDDVKCLFINKGFITEHGQYLPTSTLPHHFEGIFQAFKSLADEYLLNPNDFVENDEGNQTLTRLKNVVEYLLNTTYHYYFENVEYFKTKDSKNPWYVLIGLPNDGNIVLFIPIFKFREKRFYDAVVKKLVNEFITACKYYHSKYVSQQALKSLYYKDQSGETHEVENICVLPNKDELDDIFIVRTTNKDINTKIVYQLSPEDILELKSSS